MYQWLKSVVSVLFFKNIVLNGSPIFTFSFLSFSPELQGVNSGRGNIVLAMAEKLDILVEGIYDASIYE
jgi:hypothetical protein